jgi:outer membrane protein assembly factor BamD (BamD/ComL family)
MTMHKIALIAGALTLLSAAANAQRARTGTAAGTVASAQREDPADSLYRLARSAMNDNEYRRAADLFKQVVDKYPKSGKAGEALYWRSWSLLKLGAERRSRSDLEEALNAVERWQRDYRSSDLAGEAVALLGQIRSEQAKLGDANAAAALSESSKGLSQQRPCSGNRADEEMRIAALEGLMQMNASDAMPILEEVLKQRDPCRVELRKKAVWLVSQKRADNAARTLLEVARTDPSVEVQKDAVFWLSQTRAEIAVPLLDSLLFTSPNEELRKSAIFSLSQAAGRNERARQSLRRAAEDEKMSTELRGEAIFWLGNAQIVDLAYFRALFAKTTNHELREKVLFAVQQTRGAEATAWLQDLARNKSVDAETRKNAIFWIGQRSGVDLDVLSSIYDQAKGDDEIQDQVLFVYSQRREPAAVDKLMAVAKTDPNIERRKQALFWLGQKKNDPRVNAFLRELITRP